MWFDTYLHEVMSDSGLCLPVANLFGDGIGHCNDNRGFCYSEVLVRLVLELAPLFRQRSAERVGN